jgi:DNA invertase Pin-like site-specific DNA recombinase
MNTPTPRPGWIAQVQGHGFDLAWEQSLKSPFDPVCERIPHGDGTVIYREKVTGARPDRRELNRMLGRLAPGDVVAVTRIDRLARSTFDLFGIVKRVADTKAQFQSLAEPWADTGTSTGRLMLAVLGGPRGLWNAALSARARRKDAAGAKSRGQSGRKVPPSKKLAEAYNVGRATISRLAMQVA